MERKSSCSPPPPATKKKKKKSPPKNFKLSVMLQLTKNDILEGLAKWESEKVLDTSFVENRLFKV